MLQFLTLTIKWVSDILNVALFVSLLRISVVLFIIQKVPCKS